MIWPQIALTTPSPPEMHLDNAHQAMQASDINSHIDFEQLGFLICTIFGKYA